jgi:membrane protease YdiL (CAAX protease family)
VGLGQRAAQAGPVRRRPDPRRFVRLALAFYGTLWVVAFAWRRGLQGAPLWLAEPGSQMHWLRDGALGVLAGGVVVLLSAELTRRTRVGDRLARALAEAVGPLGPRQAWLLALVSGLAEEAFFRGALQPVAGLWLASGIFAAAHFVPRRDLLPWSVFSLAAGLLLGGLYEATGNLLAPTVAHVAINGINLNRLVRDFGEDPGAEVDFVDSSGDRDGGELPGAPRPPEGGR